MVNGGDVEHDSYSPGTWALPRSRTVAPENSSRPNHGVEGGEAPPGTRSLLKRPRHLILLETSRDQVSEDELPTLNALRRALDAGELGEEGFQTALRLGGGTASEVKRILFRPPPPKED